MRCKKARRWISDYIDGHLDEEKKADLRRHLEGCSKCQGVLEDFERITERAHNLEQVLPSAQTWMRIRSRIREERETVQVTSLEKKKGFGFLTFQPRLKHALIAVLLLAIVIGGVILGMRYGKGIFGRMDSQQYTLSKLKEAEHHYQLAINALGQAVSAQKGRLDPDVARIFQAHLEIIDFSIEACQRAVVIEPDNIEARNYLLYAYNIKLKLLDEMVAIKSTSSPEKELEKAI